MTTKRPAEASTSEEEPKKIRPVKAKPGIKLSLGKTKAVEEAKPLKRPPARVFEASSSDEEEEMPPEAKMRMKNVGKSTKTSAGGPNSFGKKAGFGFRDPRTQNERLLKQLTEELDEKEGEKR